MRYLLIGILGIFLSGCAFGGFTDKGGWIVGIGELEKGDQKVKCGVDIGAIPQR